MTRSDHAPIPGVDLPIDTPHFAAPWQARAFALTVQLVEQGVFSWPDWTKAFSARRTLPSNGPDTAAAPQAAPQSALQSAQDTAEAYFTDWLATLEALIAAARLTSPQAIAACQDRWQRAARATPHGQPILLTAAGSTD